MSERECTSKRDPPRYKLKVFLLLSLNSNRHGYFYKMLFHKSSIYKLSLGTRADGSTKAVSVFIKRRLSLSLAHSFRNETLKTLQIIISSLSVLTSIERKHEKEKSLQLDDSCSRTKRK